MSNSKEVKIYTDKLNSLKAEILLIENQRKEYTQDYVNKTISLKNEIMMLQKKKDDIENTLKSAFLEREKELDNLKIKVSEEFKISELNHASTTSILREVNFKIQEYNKNHEELCKSKIEHQNNINSHRILIEETKEVLSKRKSECDYKEELCKNMDVQSKKYLEDAINRDNIISQRMSELDNMKKRVNAEIIINKNILEENKKILENINRSKIEIVDINKSIEIDKRKVFVERQGIENDRKSLSIRKNDLDVKENDIRDKNIKYLVDLQRLIDKQKDLDAQTGKLNELRNQVNSLIEIQQSK